MKSLKFRFQNPAFFSKPIRREFFSSQKIAQIIFISSGAVFISFFSLKLFQFFSVKNKLSFSVQKSVEKSVQPSHIFPLVVNLKGQEGPQLAKVYVYINVIGDENKKDIQIENHKLEKQLLFLLSGQSIKNLNKEQFYRQIQSQLNAFLSDSLINKVRIQTEILN